MRNSFAIACGCMIGLASVGTTAHADIYQWEYINPADPSQGKRQSTTLAPDGAGVDAVPGAYLAYRDLTMAYLIGADLTGAEAYNANLSNADLSQANLLNADVFNATLTNADLSQTNLTNADFNYATLTGADFKKANLSNGDFQNAKLAGADFTGAEVRGANFYALYDGNTSMLVGGLTLAQLYSTASYQAHDLTGILLFGNNLSGGNFSGKNLTNTNFSNAALTGADFSQANLTNADFNNATLTGADLSNAQVQLANLTNTTNSGFTLAQLYSTASYQVHNLTGIRLYLNDLTGWNFAEQKLADAGFNGATLTGADFTGAEVRGASFGKLHFCLFSCNPGILRGTGITPAQLYATASYQTHDMSGTDFRYNDFANGNFAVQNLQNVNFGATNLAGANFRDANLTNVTFFAQSCFWGGCYGNYATLTDANLTAADTRGALELDDAIYNSGAITTNLIWPDGHIDGLDLDADGLLVVRDYDGNPIYGFGPISIAIDEHLTMGPGGTLRMVFDADGWDSTISFAPGIPVTLGGTLELAFADDVNLASHIGRTFDLFDWTGVNPNGTFAISSPFRWDTSKLYTIGEVTLTAVPEPSSIVLLASVLLLGVGYRGRVRGPRSQFALLFCAALVVISSAGGQRAVAATVTVMTQNLYQGFDGEKFLADVSANPQNVVALTTAAYAQVLANDFAARADAVALAVDQHRPALIGLQEASLYRSAPFNGPGPPHATNVEIDYLETLLDALSARGLSYAPVATVQNTDAEFPRLVGFDANNNPILQDIRLTDRDVILARTDLTPSQLEVSNPQSGNYSADSSALGITFRNGWTAVDVESLGTEFRFVSTHLALSPAAIQELQAAELVAGPANTSMPTILVGDFNSRGDGTGTASYANLIAAGFSDAWSAIQPDDPGYTCCQAANLLNSPSQLSERIDLALFRNGPVAMDALIVGAAPTDRTPTGLWPSDHAGIVATFHIVPEPGTLLVVCFALTALVLLRRRKQVLQIVAAVLPLIAFDANAHADIYQWEYINPADPSQRKRQSTTLAPDGAGVNAVPDADLAGRNLTMAYLIGADLTGIYGHSANLTNADLSQAKATAATFY